MAIIYPHVNTPRTSMSDMTCYDLLQIEIDATDAEIRRGYLMAAKRHHPDANPYDRTAPARFRLIQQAYDTLRHPDSRAKYDYDLKHKIWHSQQVTNDNAASDMFSSVRRSLERLMRLMAQERDIVVSKDK